jgi:hypothetical protein
MLALPLQVVLESLHTTGLGCGASRRYDARPARVLDHGINRIGRRCEDLAVPAGNLLRRQDHRLVAEFLPHLTHRIASRHRHKALECHLNLLKMNSGVRIRDSGKDAPPRTLNPES